MRTVHQWLSDYGDSHRNPTNKVLHRICVPAIVWCIIGLLWSLPIPQSMRTIGPAVNWGSIVVLASLVYYAVLSPRLALGALLLLFTMTWSIAVLERSEFAPVWMVCALLFIVAWVGQFIGHAIEGKRPSFFKDLQFLMIGPLWLLAELYRRLGIRY